MNKMIKNIIETIVEFEWNLKRIWVSNNCIYGYVVNKYGNLSVEGLYAASDFDKTDVFVMFRNLASELIRRDLISDQGVDYEVTEETVVYNYTKMLYFSLRDKCILRSWIDLKNKNVNKSNYEILEIVFNSFVLEDNFVSEEYNLINEATARKEIALNVLNSYISNESVNPIADILNKLGEEIEIVNNKIDINALEVSNRAYYFVMIDYINNCLKKDDSIVYEVQEVLESIGIETRVCSHCNNLMIEGYVISGGDEYYCTSHDGNIDSCLNKAMTKEEYDSLYEEDEETYWTEF